MIGRLLIVVCLLAPVSAWAQAPQNLTATGNDEEVSLTWQEPLVEEEDSLLCYRVYRNTTSIPDTMDPDDESEHRIARLDPPVDPAHTDTVVTNGTQYFYRVTAETAETDEETVSCGGPEAQESSFSNEAAATPAPVSLTVKAPELAEDGRTSADAFDADTPIDVVVNGVNVLPDEAVQLRYRKGGAQAFKDVPMSRSGAEFTASIPGDQVTGRGVEFAVRTQNDEGETVRTPTDGVFAVRVAVQTQSVPQPGGMSPEAYRMVSFPTRLEDPRLSTLFEPLTPYDPTEWRLFTTGGGRSASSDDVYVEQDDLSAELETGRGVWLISRSGATLRPVEGTSVRTDQPYEIPLREGWNLIGNPFAFDVSRSQLSVENTAGTLKEIYGYNGEFEMDVTVLEPYRGYLIRLSNGQAGTLTIDPTPADSGTTSLATATAQTMWQVDVSAQVAQARDGTNTLGVAPGAGPGIDPVDRREPPPIGQYVSFAFQAPTQEETFGRDIRGTDRPLHTWTAEVETNVSGRVTLRASGVPAVPQDRAVWLVDPALDLTQNLRDTPRYQFPASGDETTRRLRFLVGTPSAVQQALDPENARPANVELLPSVPNPVRTHATLRYQVPKPMRVTLALYDLLGRRVATLVDDRSVEAGTHAYTWTPDAGTQAVSSGTYLLRLQAGDMIRTRRLVVVQ